MRHKTVTGIFNFLRKRNLRSILIFSFIFISIIPIVILQYISYRRLTDNFKENIDRLSLLNINRTRDNLEILLSSYEDILYQAYTDDELIMELGNIDNNPFLRPVSINQLSRKLQALCNIKEWIEAITIITAKGNIIFYDKISSSYTNSSWLDSVGMAQNDIYAQTIIDYNTKIIPTHPTTTIAKPHYLFHLTHRIIDYKNIDKEIGIVVLTISEELLSSICDLEKTDYSFSFIINAEGRIISYPDKTKIASYLPDYENTNGASEAYHNYISGDTAAGNNNYNNQYTSVYISEPLKDWKFLLVVDQSIFHREIRYQFVSVLILGIILLIMTSIVIIVVTSMISRSLGKVTKVMKQAENGNLAVSIKESDIFPIELKVIAEAFNSMMERMQILIEQMKTASSNQRNAEIRALEAQINPHFLYNILDNINWVAIEEEQYEISKMIVSLARILRYSINRSNKIVSLEEEISWLKQYIYLQQIRFKNNFTYNLEVDDALLGVKIYKLMFQPFIENAIIHGFKNRKNNFLGITVRSEDGIVIIIQDNGNGIAPETLEKIYTLSSKPDDTHEGILDKDKDQIGFANALERIKMYYGDKADIQIQSRIDEGTKITVRLKDIIDENSDSGR